MICNECKTNKDLAGQGFTDWTCEKCGRTFTHYNTAVPKVCPECSEKYSICEECGKVVTVTLKVKVGKNGEFDLRPVSIAEVNESECEFKEILEDKKNG